MTRFGLIFSAGLAAGVLIMIPFMTNTHNGVPNSLASNSTIQKPVTETLFRHLPTTLKELQIILLMKEENVRRSLHYNVVKKENPTDIQVASSDRATMKKILMRIHPCPLQGIKKETHKLRKSLFNSFHRRETGICSSQ